MDLPVGWFGFTLPFYCYYWTFPTLPQVTVDWIQVVGLLLVDLTFGHFLWLPHSCLPDVTLPFTGLPDCRWFPSRITFTQLDVDWTPLVGLICWLRYDLWLPVVPVVTDYERYLFIVNIVGERWSPVTYATVIC